MLRKALTTIIAGVAIAAEAVAGTITFTYADNNYGKWGTAKKEAYDVAMRIDNPALTGKKITAVTAAIFAVNGISSTSIWLSEELKLDKKVNAPDVVSIPVTLDKNGNMKATLESPYTITDKGVYVGYSFNVDKLTDETESPLLLSTYESEEGFYLHTSRTALQWTNYGVKHLPVSAVIEVTVEGDFPENSLDIKSVPTVYGKAGATGTAMIEVMNCGDKAIDEIGYTYTIGNTTKTGVAKPATSIKTSLITSSQALLTFELPEKIGEYTIDFTIDKINGKANEGSVRSASTKLYTVSEIPVHRPVMEEYTGTWCGYCPRGWFALRKMNELHGEDFIAIAYHKKDPMATIPVDQFPKYVEKFGYPAATLDRGELLDPYYGKEYLKTPFAIESMWEEARKLFSPADIKAYAWWKDADKKAIDVVSFTKFVIEEDDTDYRLSYTLCADDLHSTDEEWNQSNYFVEEAATFAGTELAELSKMPEPINDMHFNEVMLASSNILGETGILPANTRLNEKTEDHYTFEIPEYIAPLIQNPEKLYVVAMVIDGKTGKIVNAAKAPVALEPAGIDTVVRPESAEVVAVRYTDLQGRVVKSPASGIYVKTVKYSDGTVKSEKLLVK